MTDTRIGFIGLGVMGTPMARNLLGAGCPLVVHNRTPAKAQALAQLGARVAGSPREVAQLSEVVITMLPDSPDVERVHLADGGLLARRARSALHRHELDPGAGRPPGER